MSCSGCAAVHSLSGVATSSSRGPLPLDNTSDLTDLFRPVSWKLLICPSYDFRSLFAAIFSLVIGSFLATVFNSGIKSNCASK